MAGDVAADPQPRPGHGFRHLGDREVYRGHIWTVVQGTFANPRGEEFHRDVVRSPGAVATIPILFDAEGVPSVVMVRQYRAAFDEMILEIPAGMRDVQDEPLETTASRELIEEVGLTAANLEPLVRYYSSTGMTDSVLHVYLATDLAHVEREPHGPEEEHAEVVHMPLAEALELIGVEIFDSKTVIALLLVDRQLRAADRSA
jgi:ADP-ribose pyrophosphatase